MWRTRLFRELFFHNTQPPVTISSKEVLGAPDKQVPAALSFIGRGNSFFQSAFCARVTPPLHFLYCSHTVYCESTSPPVHQHPNLAHAPIYWFLFLMLLHVVVVPALNLIPCLCRCVCFSTLTCVLNFNPVRMYAMHNSNYYVLLVFIVLLSNIIDFQR
jgi:hypothetical protein